MKLLVRQTYPCSVDTFWKMYWDDEFDAILRRESAVSRELVEERRDGDVVTRRVKFTPDRDLPGPAAALLGSSKLIYEQENRWDPGASRLDWRVIPTILPGKLDAKGWFVVRAAPGGCEQVVEGDISVQVRFVGGQIEKAIVAEVQQSYEKMGAACRTFLRDKGWS